MALVKCPECGRENVSDSADACPDCGYGIKAHYDNEKIRQLEEKKYQLELRSVQKPKEPQFNYFQVVIMTLPGILGFLFNPAIGIIAICFCLFIAIVNTNNEFNEAMKKYELSQKDFERYQKEELHRQKLKMLEDETKLKCPQCGSTNIEKISTTSRAVSVAAVGLASGKIGKQYKCKKCKHMW